MTGIIHVLRLVPNISYFLRKLMHRWIAPLVYRQPKHGFLCVSTELATRWLNSSVVMRLWVVAKILNCPLSSALTTVFRPPLMTSFTSVSYFYSGWGVVRRLISSTMNWIWKVSSASSHRVPYLICSTKTSKVFSIVFSVLRGKCRQ